VAVNTTALMAGAVVISAVAAAWLISSRFGESSKSANAVTQAHNSPPNAAARPAPVFASYPVPAVTPLPQPANTQNEFAADDAAVQRAADDYAAQTDETAAHEFAARFHDLAERFAAESGSDIGNRLRTETLNHLSEDAGPAPTALQMECRQTICRVQLTGSEPDKSKTMQDIQGVGGFRQVVGMERPAGDGAMISDFYLVMNRRVGEESMQRNAIDVLSPLRLEENIHRWIRADRESRWLVRNQHGAGIFRWQRTEGQVVRSDR
jgi:hypothetical protein